jgi:hypothetical protein
MAHTQPPACCQGWVEAKQAAQKVLQRFLRQRGNRGGGVGGMADACRQWQ